MLKFCVCFVRDVVASKVWGVWVDVKCCVCFVRHVVASKVWGCVDGC